MDEYLRWYEGKEKDNKRNRDEDNVEDSDGDGNIVQRSST